MKIYPFKLSHLDMIDIQDAQKEDLSLLRLAPDDRQAAITIYPSFSLIDHEICYASFGQFPIDLEKNIGFVWCLLANNIGHRMVQFFRLVKDGLDGSCYDEVQTLVNMKHIAAVRMIKMLGFQFLTKSQFCDTNLFFRRRLWV
jgi:hypothetical protein